MSTMLSICFRFIQPYPLFHGRGDGSDPEWPPSPLRAFQALVNAAGLRTRGKPLPPNVRRALEAIEVLQPAIIAPHAILSTVGHRAYVPHNQADLVASAWNRGNIDASIAAHRIEKDFRPHRIESAGEDLPAIHYLYALPASGIDSTELLSTIRPYVRSIYSLGWGIDQVIADATLIDPLTPPEGERWMPVVRGSNRLRSPCRGTLAALLMRHEKFLSRLTGHDWTPVSTLSAFEVLPYRRDNDPIPHPHAVFKLLDDNDDTVTYPQSKLVHLAGMVRHLAIEAMKRNPPRDLRGRDVAEWLEAYVAGHQSPQDKAKGHPHSQFSYIPLQSIGAPHTDPGVRRVMIVTPVGDEAWLEHIAQQLEGKLLRPLPNTTLPEGTRLERIEDHRKDGVRDAYLRPSVDWASVTPVILPGHDDHKPAKTRGLILKALQQSGMDQPCEFDWSPFSQFRKMLSAHKYRKDPSDPTKTILINYVRPDHLLDKTAVHLTLRFGRREDPNDLQSPWIPAQVPIPGPIAIGAGRHCGFGLLSRCP